MNTIVIAQVLGIFLAVTGISMVVNSRGTANAIEAAVQDKGLFFTWGILALLIGATVVVLNDMWTSGLPLLVTILGWITLIKGVFILILPGAAVALYRKINKSGLLMFCGVIVFILGLILLYW